MISIYTIESHGIGEEPIRLCVAAYNHQQAVSHFNASPYKAGDRQIHPCKYDDIRKSVQKKYELMIENPGTVYRFEFANKSWNPVS